MTSNATSLLFILLALFVGPAARGAETLAPGDRFPDLQAFGLEGSLPDLAKARVVIVDFWASWCAPCKASFPVFNELQDEFGSRGLAIIAVSVDRNEKQMAAFLQRQPVSFVVVRDAGMKLVSAVDVPAMPTSFVLDAQGIVRFVHVGFHGEETRARYAEEIAQLLAESA